MGARVAPAFVLAYALMAEVAAALSRTGSAAGLAQQYALAIGQLPDTILVALDEGLAQRATALGAQHKLRGADSVFFGIGGVVRCRVGDPRS